MSGYYEKVIRDTRKAARKVAKEVGKPAAEKRKLNPAGKMRPADNPYATWTCANGTWEYRLHKSYQRDNSGPYARWMVAAKSPHTYGQWELGDEYVDAALEFLDARSVKCDLTVWKSEVDFMTWAWGGEA